MRTLSKEECKIGTVVVFVDRALNHGESQVGSDRVSVPLDGREGVIVHVDHRTAHDTKCASTGPLVKSKRVVHVEDPDDPEAEKKQVEQELVEHPACDCGYSPGTQLAICLREPHDKAHTCGGMTPEQHGVWAALNHLYTPQQHAAHKEANGKAREKSAEHEKRLAKSRAAAAAFLGKSGT